MPQRKLFLAEGVNRQAERIMANPTRFFPPEYFEVKNNYSAIRAMLINSGFVDPPTFGFETKINIKDTSDALEQGMYRASLIKRYECRDYVEIQYINGASSVYISAGGWQYDNEYEDGVSVAAHFQFAHPSGEVVYLNSENLFGTATVNYDKGGELAEASFSARIQGRDYKVAKIPGAVFDVMKSYGKPVRRRLELEQHKIHFPESALILKAEDNDTVSAQFEYEGEQGKPHLVTLHSQLPLKMDDQWPVRKLKQHLFGMLKF